MVPIKLNYTPINCQVFVWRLRANWCLQGPPPLHFRRRSELAIMRQNSGLMGAKTLCILEHLQIRNWWTGFTKCHFVHNPNLFIIFASPKLQKAKIWENYAHFSIILHLKINIFMFLFFLFVKFIQVQVLGLQQGIPIL